MVMKVKIFFLSLCMALIAATSALANPTDITVRVKAKDGKFLGTHVGGALITIKDAQTGELLAKGLTMGVRRYEPDHEVPCFAGHPTFR
jgi:hypothetical protein